MATIVVSEELALKLTKAYRKSAAQSGVALPNGKFPIPDKAHLRAAIAYRHRSSVPYKQVQAHIAARAKALGVKVPVLASAEEFSKGPGARQGRSNSLKWPWLYDKLRAKGYDKSKAAAISNSRIGTRKHGRISVLSAKAAHNPAVLKRLAKADKAGKHSTKGSLRASGIEEFMNKCHDPKDGKFCTSVVHTKVSRGVMKKGTESYTTKPGVCGKPTDGGEMCGLHKAVAANTRTKLLAKRERELMRKTFPVITKAQARGDSRPVTHEEFQSLARTGQRQLNGMADNASATTGLDQHWTKIKAESYAEVRKPWGGATIDSHTGKALPQGANAFALTVKGVGVKTISVHENATEAEFNAAMDQAKKAFGPALKRVGHHLGVFHDDENHRIDIDPVIIVTNRKDVDTIGAATHAVGGAYNFSDGNGYWPPHVAET